MHCSTILETVFRHFTHTQQTMTCTQFVSFATDCKFLTKPSDKPKTELMFAQCTSTMEDHKAINFDMFKDNITHFATMKNMTKNDIIRKIEAFGKHMFYESYMNSSNKTQDSESTSTASSQNDVSESSEESMSEVDHIKNSI